MWEPVNTSCLPGPFTILPLPNSAAKSLKAKRPHSPGESQLPSPRFPTLGFDLRFVARLLKAILDQLASPPPQSLGVFEGCFAMQGLPDPLPQLETLEGGPQSQLLQLPGVSWTAHCFPPAVMCCHSPSTSCRTPRVLTRSEMASATQSSKPQPGWSGPNSSPSEGRLLPGDPQPIADL